MSAKIDTNWHFHGVRAVTLENRQLRIVILPETGGRIYSLLHKPSDRDFLWQHPRIRPRPTPFGTSYDDNLVGGWDDMLPTVDACLFNGERIPDHGELWSLPWDWQVIPADDGSACLYTSVAAPITPVRLERWLCLDADQPELRVRYRLTNLAPYPVELIWGIHPTFAISPQHRLDLPPARMLVELASADRLGQPGQMYDWHHLPAAGGVVDMRMLPPPEALLVGGHYAVAPSQPWFALTDQARRVGVAMVYPPEVFRALWLWMSFGGWRNLYHLAVEPWTGYPVNLEKAAAAGRQTTLTALQSISYEVTVFAYTGLTHVAGIERRDQHYAAFA